VTLTAQQCLDEVLGIAPETRRIADECGDDAAYAIWRISMSFSSVIERPANAPLNDARDRLVHAMDHVLTHGDEEARETVTIGVLECVAHLPPDELEIRAKSWPPALLAIIVELADSQRQRDPKGDTIDAWNAAISRVRESHRNRALPEVMAALNERLSAVTESADPEGFPQPFLELIARDILNPNWKYRHPLRYMRLRRWNRIAG
jgi:hypothetical protein